MKFATIGTSAITKKWIKAGRTCPGFELRAVFSRNQESAEHFAADMGAGKYYTDLKMLEEDPEIEAVYIASPNALHARQAERMLRNGKHVLCEKALASNVSEARQLFGAAHENHRVLLEAVRSLHDPAFEDIRKKLSLIGPIRSVRFSYGKYSSRYDDYKAGKEPNIFSPKFSAGALMDLGVYCVEPLFALFGQPESIQASCVHLANGIDGAGSALLTYPDFTAVLSYMKTADDETKSLVAGEKGSLYIPVISEPGRHSLVLRTGERKEADRPDAASNIAFEIENFIKMVKGTADPLPFEKITLGSLRIMDEIRRQCGLVFPADII
jgi:predicted dehydrogenase